MPFCIFFFSMVWLVSCQKSSVSHPPKDLIGEEKMVDLMAEQLLFESTLDFVSQGLGRGDTTLYAQVSRQISGKVLPADSVLKNQENAMRQLALQQYAAWFKEKKITPEQFESSFKYYASDPEKIERMMKQAQQKLASIRM